MIVLRDAVIPAGGTIPDSYARAIGSPCRALAPIGHAKRHVMQIVVNALRDSGAVRRIIAVSAGPVSQAISGVDLWLPASDEGIDNILRGLGALESSDKPAIIAASDLPFLTADAVRRFVERCSADEDLSLGIIRAESYRTAFPAAPKSQWVSLRDAGQVTIGGLFGVKPAVMFREAEYVKRVMSARKSQWRMARLLGPRLLLAWATGSLTLAGVAARGEHLLNCRAKIIQDAPVQLAFDIDTENDYTYADSCL